MRLNMRPVLAGLAIGAVAAIAIVLLPRTAIESLGTRTHLADILSVAKPPLGNKARMLIAAIPFVLMTLIGLAIGILTARKNRFDDEFGVYPDYNLGAAPTADPFADEPTAYDPPAPPMADPFPTMPAPPPVAAQPLPLPPAASIALDGATAADLAEIADTVVRLSARLDAVEARLDAAPTASPSAIPADLTDRLAKIVRALDDAG